MCNLPFYAISNAVAYTLAIPCDSFLLTLPWRISKSCHLRAKRWNCVSCPKQFIHPASGCFIHWSLLLTERQCFFSNFLREEQIRGQRGNVRNAIIVSLLNPLYNDSNDLEGSIFIILWWIVILTFKKVILEAVERDQRIQLGKIPLRHKKKKKLVKNKLLVIKRGTGGFALWVLFWLNIYILF